MERASAKLTFYFVLFTFFASACATHKPVPPPSSVEPAPVAADTCAPAPVPSPPPPEAERPTASLFPAPNRVASVQPGEVVLVALDGPVGRLAAVSAALGNTVAPVLPGPDAGPWLGLLPVNRDREPGEATVRVLFTYQNGSTTRAELPFLVQPRQYPSVRLTVAPDMAQIPPERESQVAEDRAAFAAVWSAPAAERLWSGPFIMPAEGRVSATFGERRVFNGDVQSRHSGIDIAAPMSAPVWASNAGRVVLVRVAYLEGRTVVIDHGGGLFTFYCHLSQAQVAVGDLVSRGQVIGNVGMTGRATGPHLHFGVRVAGERVDGLALIALRPEEESQK